MHSAPTPLVCVHTPPPEEGGLLKAACAVCRYPLKPRKPKDEPKGFWQLWINGGVLTDSRKEPYDKIISMARVLAYSNKVWMISPNGMKFHPHLLRH